jgi:hypothetical protein
MAPREELITSAVSTSHYILLLLSVANRCSLGDLYDQSPIPHGMARWRSCALTVTQSYRIPRLLHHLLRNESHSCNLRILHKRRSISPYRESARTRLPRLRLLEPYPRRRRATPHNRLRTDHLHNHHRDMVIPHIINGSHLPSMYNPRLIVLRTGD